MQTLQPLFSLNLIRHDGDTKGKNDFVTNYDIFRGVSDIFGDIRMTFLANEIPDFMTQSKWLKIWEKKDYRGKEIYFKKIKYLYDCNKRIRIEPVMF